MPASVMRPRLKLDIAEAKQELDKPHYKDGVIQWKGMDISIKEAREFNKQMSRTPVSRGRFPTEADLIIDSAFGVFPDFDISVLAEKDIEKIERWKENYLTAIDGIRTRVDDELLQDAYDDLYWKIYELDLGQFAKAMYEHDAELSIIFQDSPTSKKFTGDALEDRWVSRISGIWEKYVGS